MSGYLDLAKKVSTKISPESDEELASRRRRKLEEASRRGLVVRWSEYPDWMEKAMVEGMEAVLNGAGRVDVPVEVDARISRSWGERN